MCAHVLHDIFPGKLQYKSQMSVHPRSGTDDRTKYNITKVQLGEPLSLLGSVTRAGMTQRQLHRQKPTQPSMVNDLGKLQPWSSLHDL